MLIIDFLFPLSFLMFIFVLGSSHQVKHGQTFTFDIKGRAVAASLEFSFTKFNFGKCFLYSPGMEPATQTLVLRNNSERDIRCVSGYQEGLAVSS